MFSGFAVYVGVHLVCMLRDSPKSPRDNGVWLVLSESTDPGDAGLRREFPSLRSIELLGNKIGHWLLIPSESRSWSFFVHLSGDVYAANKASGQPEI